MQLCRETSAESALSWIHGAGDNNLDLIDISELRTVSKLGEQDRLDDCRFIQGGVDGELHVRI